MVNCYLKLGKEFFDEGLLKYASSPYNILRKRESITYVLF